MTALIEYDVTPEGEIELVALINAMKRTTKTRPGGLDGLAGRARRWRGGRVGVPPEQDLKGHVGDRGPRCILAIAEGIILADGATRRWPHEHHPIAAYRLARDLGNIEAAEHGYKRSGLSGKAGGAAQRPASWNMEISSMSGTEIFPMNGLTFNVLPESKGNHCWL